MLDLYNQFKDFKSIEVVFNNSNGEPQKNYCSVKSIEENSLLLDANNQQNKNIFANVNDEIKIYVYTDSGVYSATSKVLQVTNGLMNTEYLISYPTNSKHSQRREYFRADMSVDFHMNVITSLDSDVNISIDSKTKNICGKGMSYLAKAPFPEYESIDIDLIFPDENIIQTSAKHVYSKQIYIANKPAFIHAFMFVDISQKNIDFIVKKCFQHQLELKRKFMV